MALRTKSLLLIFLLISFSEGGFCIQPDFTGNPSAHDLQFKRLSRTWDDGVPLGNGILGQLVWKKGTRLRFSLDRADLWDLRPMENIGTAEWTFRWVFQHWLTHTYRIVQEKFDRPYDQKPAPTKIPAGALEFDTRALGRVLSVHLCLNTALCEIKWESGARLLTFVQANKPVGWFRFENLPSQPNMELAPPAYTSRKGTNENNPVKGQDLRRLGYVKGMLIKNSQKMVYTQPGWGGFRYQIAVTWKNSGQSLEGCWSISSEFPGWKKQPEAQRIVAGALKRGFTESVKEHRTWWNHFWTKSVISLPDKILERRWYLEQYKFGCAARSDAPPISLQAIWTADNGRLPPWKGDFHHDLNTELSYWPAYSANHVDLETGFINWLWKNKPTFEKYTRAYFGTNGLNVPGVTTLTGEPMGGWIQYSFGPTVAAWLGQHVYLHWRYTMDKAFLRTRAYPWIRDTATYLTGISVRGRDGKRRLPLSSSPEFNDNSREAWFAETTNFDLALIRWTLQKAAELAAILGKTEEARRWNTQLGQWPALDTDSTGLTVAPGFPYHFSHRHFSHLMAIFPLGLLDVSHGEKEQAIIQKSLCTLEKYGSDWWTGYSFAWLGNLYARARDGEKAARALRIFATAFCLPNSFHVNGDQSGKGYSKFTYRPFTLEGNFAFASGIQQMLIQSHTGVVLLFPAIPKIWQDVSFQSLRTEGAFLISARRKKGTVTEVIIQSEKGGLLRLQNPFAGAWKAMGGTVNQTGPLLEVALVPGQIVTLKQQRP